MPVGRIDVARFAQAWRVLVARHPVLRTGILWQGGLSRPLQLVYRAVDAAVPVIDWRGQDASDARIARVLAPPIDHGHGGIDRPVNQLQGP